MIFSNKIPQARVLPNENKKNEHHLWILHLQIGPGTKFCFEFFDQICPKHVPLVKNKKISNFEFRLLLKILIFRSNLPKKGISGRKWKKRTSPLYSAYLNYSEYQVSLYTNNFRFWDQICPKKTFSVKDGKCEHHLWILHIRISLGTKFDFNQIILNFGTKFARKEYLRSKTKKVSITIEFCIFELV